MYNLRTIFLCVLFATQTSTMELSQNSNNKRIIIPRRVETLFKLAIQCVINHQGIRELRLGVCDLPHEVKKEYDCLRYLADVKCRFGFEKEDFTFSLDELINHGKISILSDQRRLDVESMQINVIRSLTLRTIANKCSFLTSLYLERNKLKKIPESIGLLTTLEVLRLGNNQLEKLPNFMTNLVNLVLLSFPRNLLAKLPDSFGRLTKLEAIELSYNLLDKLPDSFGKLTKLEFFYLHGNLFSKLPNLM